MPTNHTQNYQLSQWVKSDQVKMEDFNADNAKIDAALHSLSGQVAQKAPQSALSAETAARTALAAQVAKLGNCRICYMTYAGDGQDTRTFTFPLRPLLVYGMSSGLMIRTMRGLSVTLCRTNGEGGCGCSTSWSGNSMTWTGTQQPYSPNAKGQTYYLVALMDASE